MLGRAAHPTKASPLSSKTTSPNTQGANVSVAWPPRFQLPTNACSKLNVPQTNQREYHPMNLDQACVYLCKV